MTRLKDYLNKASQRQKSYMQRMTEMGYTQVRFFIDSETAQLFDELIENEMRNSLTQMSKQKSREIIMRKALFILKEESSDMQYNDILAAENADLRKKLAVLELELKELKKNTEPESEKSEKLVQLQPTKLTFDLEKAKQFYRDVIAKYRGDEIGRTAQKKLREIE